MANRPNLGGSRRARRHGALRQVAAILFVSFQLLGVCEAAWLAAAPSNAVASADPSDSGGQFYVAQGRILDTRASSQVGPYSSPFPGGTWRAIDVAGTAGVPSSGVAAVALNFTVVSPTTAGLIHADLDEATPNATVTYMNYIAGTTTSNSGVVTVASDGKIQVYTSTRTDMLIDVQGYYTQGSPAAGGYVPITPQRIVDTRTGLGLPASPLQPGTTSTIQVTGRAGIPAGASGAIVNFTVVNQTKASWISPYPADGTRSLASVNFGPTTDATAAQVGLSTTQAPVGAFKLYNASATTDLVVDVVGYFTSGIHGGGFFPSLGRVLDTRQSQALAAGGTVSVQIEGLAGVPYTRVAAVAADIAVVAPSASGYLRAWAAGTSEPGTSVLNYQPSSNQSNMATVGVGSNGAIEVSNHSSAPVDIVLDIEGWYGITYDPSAEKVLPGVQISTDGWITYTNTMTAQLDLSGGTLSTVNGTVDALDGSCEDIGSSEHYS